MKQLEQAFEAELLRRCEQAAAEQLCRTDRFSQTIQKYGALRTMQEVIRKGRVSDTFDALAQQGRLELTAEALVTDSRFGALFTDDEVNACFMLLCEYGFFG